MKYFIGFVPSEAVYETVVSIQSSFGDNRLEPHITLRPPVTVTHKDEWFAAIEEVCSNFPPVSIDLPGTGYFGKRVLFIKASSEQLNDLHSTLLKAIKPFEQKDPKTQYNQEYHPHLTLGRQWCGFTKHDFEKMKALADAFLSGAQVRFTATAIRIYHKPLQHGRYEPMKDIQLGADLKAAI